MRKSRCLLAVLFFTLIVPAGNALGAELSKTELLGKSLFFDKRLSTPAGQSCADCHGPKVGFTGPVPAINKKGAVYPGAVHERFGNRKPPTSAYGGDSPVFDYVQGLFTGGMFWDGRATGWVTGDPLADQAMGPFLNPVEQNNPSEEAVCLKVAKAPYAGLYPQVFGTAIDCTLVDADGHLQAYKNFAIAIASYERSEQVNPFTSKFDYWQKGKAELTPQELMGWKIFNDKGNCAACHPAPLFTDFTYDNLGVPRNPANPFYRMDTVYLDDGSAINPEGANWVDPGLAGFLDTLPESYFAGLGLIKADEVAAALGKHKVPTLRNAAMKPGRGFVKAYAHNGVFKSLAEVVKFYDERDAMIAAGMAVPEVPENINSDELGDLDLSDAEEAALVAFMETLSDGYQSAGGKGGR